MEKELFDGSWIEQPKYLTRLSLGLIEPCIARVEKRIDPYGIPMIE